MIAIIAIPTLLLYVSVLGFTMWRMVESNKRQVEQNMAERAAACAGRFDDAFERAAAVARTTAALLETAPDLGEEQLFAQLRANVALDESIYGAAIAFEPGTFKADDSLFAPYVFRGKGGLESTNITREVYDWYADRRWGWWHLPKASGAPAWTAPYFDEGAGNVLMVTYSVPFKRAGKFRGVTTVDIQISRIRERVGTSIVGSADFVLLTHDGQFVSAPREQDVMSGRTVFDVVAVPGREDLAIACREALAGNTGVAAVAAWGNSGGGGAATPGREAGWERWSEKSWLFYAPIKSTGWTLAAMTPQSIAFARARIRMIETAAALAVTLVLIIGCIALAAGYFTRRISRLGTAIHSIAAGDLEHHLPVTSRDELGRLSHDVNVMTRELKRHTEQMAKTRSRSREAMIFALAKLAESRDDDTGKHVERVCRYTGILADELARSDTTLDGDWVHTVTVTAALHDIGKVGIPDGVLKKPGKLTDEEFVRMRTHTTIGGDTLIAVRREWTEDDFLRTAAEIALGHHEKWDGTGYPYGLSKDDIALSARIVAVADVYDALTSKRVYKAAMPHEQAAKIITEGAGKHFDPRVVEAFVRVQEQFRAVSAAAATGNGEA